ncbi:hypothetical protein BC941DRAFT_444370 [Chlamydoabsidia padenii]|nr:hypothetical protein BC941DRAFT_444370 [Chlamydoabsidia padenii]
MTIRGRLHHIISSTPPTDLVRPACSLSPSWQRDQNSSFSSTNSGGNDDYDDVDIDNKSHYTEATTSCPSSSKTTTVIDYHIVLVDIKKTVKERKIECVKKLMDEPGLRYCAISYRWGEVPEQLVETPDYIAHVTSFALSDLEILCGQILASNDFTNEDDDNETTKKSLEYLWVDAISIDQQNEKARKATIRQMNRIYHHSTLILAVPDLHLSYLKQNPSSKASLARIRKHSSHIYRHASGACQFQPIVTPVHRHHTYEFSQVSNTVIQPSSSSTTEARPSIIPGYDSSSSSSSSSLLTPVTPSTPDNKQNSEKPPLCECYRRNSKHEGKSYIEAIEFLDWLVMDWSNRCWVISEYYIGRTKTMELWFLSFDLQWFYSSRFRFIPLFDSIYRDHFRHRRFLDMMLNSCASKNEDRFYAILPLSINYRHHIETQDTVSQWNISDMTSVCMRLYDFVGLLEKIAILYCCSKGRSLILPSFASCYNEGNNTVTKILELDPQRLLIQSITLMAPTSQQQQQKLRRRTEEEKRYHRYGYRHDNLQESHRERAFLKVKTSCYRILSTTINRDTKVFWDRHAKICNQLEWKFTRHHQKNHLNQAFMPLVESETHTPIGIHLVGDRNANRWVVYQLTMINVNAPASEWQFVKGVEEFNIY